MTLYEAIFSGKKICEAFDEAVKTVSFVLKSTEAELFTMLVQENITNYFDHRCGLEPSKKHKCRSLPAVRYGPWKCFSEHILVKKIPARVANFKFRDKDMSRLLELLIV